MPSRGPRAVPLLVLALMALVLLSSPVVAADGGLGGRGPQEDGSPSAWIIVGMIAGVGALLGTVGTRLLVRREDHGAEPPRDSVHDDIFDAHRRLTEANDEASVGDIGCRAAVTLTGAHDAAIFRRVADGLRRTGDTAVIVQSALKQVVETGKPLLTEIEGDPAFSEHATLCAVPLIDDSGVSGVLMVCGSVDHPFDEEDQRRLELLAPAIGGALLGADALNSYEHLAMVDGLTSLGNRRRLDEDLEATLGHASERNLLVGFAMIDVDHFKLFNDTHGHEAGDAALQTVARVIAASVRSNDVVYRYGGEEFSVLLPGAADHDVVEVAERIRVAVEATPVPGEETQPGGRLTVSIGVATRHDEGELPLKTRADKALYRAKAQGRNCSMLT